MTQGKATPIIILGMHRSGTSCLAGALQQAGLYLGDVSKYNPYNKKGNREHNEIMQLNDMILEYNDGSWDKPPKTSLIWTKTHVKMAKDLIKKLESSTTTGFWGFKDPRTLLTYSFWEKVLINPVLVGTFRDPEDVAYSLCNRRGSSFDMTEAFSLWYTYNMILVTMVGKHKFPLISFDLPSMMYEEKLKNIGRLLNLPTQKNIDFYDECLITKKNKSYKKATKNIISNCNHLYTEMSKYQT